MALEVQRVAQVAQIAIQASSLSRDVILCAVRRYLRYPLSYQDIVDLLSERDVAVDRSTLYRWVQKFGTELTKRTDRRSRRASVDWHVDETYVRVGGR